MKLKCFLKSGVFEVFKCISICSFVARPILWASRPPAFDWELGAPVQGLACRDVIHVTFTHTHTHTHTHGRSGPWLSQQKSTQLCVCKWHQNQRLARAAAVASPTLPLPRKVDFFSLFVDFHFLSIILIMTMVTLIKIMMNIIITCICFIKLFSSK